jgi:hypothetical protein
MHSHLLHKRSAFISPNVFEPFSIISLHQQIASLHCKKSVLLAAITASRKEDGGDHEDESAGKPSVHFQLIIAQPRNILSS